MYDFHPFLAESSRSWGEHGFFTDGDPGPMRASIGIPEGLTVGELEYYVYNNSGSAVAADAYVYVPGQGSIVNLEARGSIASSTKITAKKVSVPEANQGPFPTGAAVIISVNTPNDGSVQVNGARIGFGGLDSGWVSCALKTGFTGSMEVRKRSGVVYCRGVVSRSAGSFPDSYETFATLPEDFEPAGEVRALVDAYITANLNNNVLVIKAGSRTVAAGRVGGGGKTIRCAAIPPWFAED